METTSSLILNKRSKYKESGNPENSRLPETFRHPLRSSNSDHIYYIITHNIKAIMDHIWLSFIYLSKYSFNDDVLNAICMKAWCLEKYHV